jgi:RNA polymerase sigma factor (sigma-70 family)
MLSNEDAIKWLPYIRKIAYRIFKKYRICPYEDLVGYGCIGLVKAFQKYEKNKNDSFKHYISNIVEFAMIDGVRNFGWFSDKSCQDKSMDSIEANDIENRFIVDVDMSNKLELKLFIDSLPSQREKKIVECLASGYTQREIAQNVGLTESRISQLVKGMTETYYNNIRKG